MYQYPLTFTFPMLSVTPQFDATDAAGKSLFSASKKLLSSKDEISVVAKGRTYFKIISQENRITDIPSNWDVMTGDGMSSVLWMMITSLRSIHPNLSKTPRHR